MQLFADSSLRILRPSTMERLSQMLNPRRHLLSEDGLIRDYRGLGEMAGLSAQDMAKIEEAPDHFRQLVMLWIRNPEVTVATMTAALTRLDRHDVLEDTQELLVRDCEAAREHGLSGLASQTVRINNKEVLTLQDLEAVSRGQPLPQYDAMLMFSNDDLEDEMFAMHLLERMEDAGLKVFAPSRDLIAGTIEHSASEKIIAKRCKKVVIVFTPALLASDEADFLIDLAQYVSIQKRTAMLVPIMFKRCDDLPEKIQMLTKMKYEKGYVNFYDRLFKQVFKLTNYPVDLTIYPDEFKDSFDRSTKNSNAAARVPALPSVPIGATPSSSTAAFAEFTNLATASSVRSDDLNTVSTTYSTLDSQTVLVRQAPSPPSQDPGSSGSQVAARAAKAPKSSKTSSPIKKMVKVLKRGGGKKDKDYQPA